MSDIIKLSNKSFFNANFDLLEPNFSFFVNGKEYQTHKFIASLLSPALANLLATDKLVDSFEILTANSQGDFQLLLNLVSSGEQVIPDQDKEFIFEILNILQNDNLEIDLKSRSLEITYENALPQLLQDLKFPHYYHDAIDQEIKVIAENMFQILRKKEARQLLSQLDMTIIEQILNHKHLIVDNEDQLLSFVNSLYQINKEFRDLYQYVDFVFCSSAQLQHFFQLFSIEDINPSIWRQLEERLQSSNERQSSTRRTKHCLQSTTSVETFTTITPGKRVTIDKGTSDFDGIINYLRKQTNNQIEDEIKITASSIARNDVNKYSPYNSIDYDSCKYFCSMVEQNSWICFEFQNLRIIPTCYTIQSNCFGLAPLNFKLEILNDQSEWEEIDTQIGAPFGNENLKTLTFSIDENKRKETKSIRLTQTGRNSSGSDQLILSSIEFCGEIIFDEILSD